tara:strand:- start:995 stop:1522 length:528 start_codon:yes stop_codon:yes gene_type:complete
VTKYKNFFLIFILVNITTYSYSQNIVYANLDYILQNSLVGKKIINHFEKLNQKLSNEINNDKKLILEKEKSLISKKNILDEEEFTSEVKNLRNELISINNLNKEKLNNINNDKGKVSESFMSQINLILKEFAETNNIDIIISSKQMLIGKSNLDVTDDLIKIVDKKIKKFEIKND